MPVDSDGSREVYGLVKKQILVGFDDNYVRGVQIVSHPLSSHEHLRVCVL
jgi:hypothetical protein